MTALLPHYQPRLFRSFFQGSFPCSTACRSGGRRLDMVVSSGHDMLLDKDYAALAGCCAHCCATLCRNSSPAANWPGSAAASLILDP
ncbi:hypothetical protein CRX72_14360 [Pantoea sp. BRM17]|nr:hypothetical protein CRX72_14360 [Pantoea sp. BRM17]